MRIVFMGTPDYALFSLRALVEAGENVVGVVTQPDKPKGRGYTLTPPPVKVYAQEKGIPVFQPERVKDGSFDAVLKELAPDVCVVAAYGKILPQSLLDIPRHGCLNIHGSLLPEYRGAAPMQRAIIDGKKVTGVTIQQMALGMDTGDILLMKDTEIREEDNFEDIHDRLGVLGAEALMETIKLLREGKLKPVKQDDSLATYAAKIEKADCALDFTRLARQLHDQIRGMSPFPLAFTHLPGGSMLKITRSRVEADEGQGTPGQVVSLEDGIVVQCGQGRLRLLGVLPEGKGRMAAADFVRGRKIAEGDILN